MVRFVQRGKILNLSNSNFQELYFFLSQFLKICYSMFLFLMLLRLVNFLLFGCLMYFGGLSRMHHVVSNSQLG